MRFKYRLEASHPDRREGGVNRTATARTFPALTDIALYSMSIEPAGMRELHWHPNAHELSYVLTGNGEAGIFSPLGDHGMVALAPGSLTFVPCGHYHYIRNTGELPLRLLVGFTHPQPEHIDLSAALPYVPQELLAQTFGLPADQFPRLPDRGDRFLVPVEETAARPPESGNGRPYSVNLDEVAPTRFEGGTANEAGTKQLPRLEGITLYHLRGEPRSLREPHWHPNASELNYCVSGHAQIAVVAPDGGMRERFTVGPGDVAYVPRNYFHYIASLGDEPLNFLVFFSADTAQHIDISQTFDWFPREVIAASFGMDRAAFDELPRRGDVFQAKPGRP
jgi:oxalate decarboxylase